MQSGIKAIEVEAVVKERSLVGHMRYDAALNELVAQVDALLSLADQTVDQQPLDKIAALEGVAVELVMEALIGHYLHGALGRIAAPETLAYCSRLWRNVVKRHQLERRHQAK